MGAAAGTLGDLLAILAGSCSILLLYAFVGYPLVLRAARRRPFDAVRGVAPRARSAVLMPLHEPGAELLPKLEELAAIAASGVEVVVIADACSERVLSLVAAFPQLASIRSEARLGKERALRLGLENTSAEHIVFTDVGTRFGQDDLDRLLRVLAHPGVGAVSSEDLAGVGAGLGDGESRYVSAEMKLRRLESARGGLIGMSGNFFAARRVLCLAVPDHASRDFGVALECHRRGLLALHVVGARGRYATPSGAREDFRRRRRTFVHGMQTLWEYRDLLAPAAGLTAFKLWSHKILRWAAPWLALGASGSLLILTDDPGAWLLPLSAGALIALVVPWSRRRLLHVLVVNAALVAATLSLLRRCEVGAWQPTLRTSPS